MSDTAPVRNLPDQAEPWGRYIESAVSNLRSAIDLLAQKTGNSNGALNTSYDSLASQLKSLVTIDELATETYALRTLPAVSSSSASNFSLSTSYATVVSTSVTVPAGFTRALVSGYAGITGSTGSTGGDRFYGRTNIAGASGPEIIQPQGVSPAIFASIAPSHTASLSGLSAGSLITVSADARLQVGPNNSLYQPYNTAAISVSALFLA